MKLETSKISREPSKQPSIADAIIPDKPFAEFSAEEPKPSAAAPEQPALCPAHLHPEGVREAYAGEDREGRPIWRTVPARTATYIFNCKACIWEDRKRMNSPSELMDLGTVLFLVPESDYDQQVCRAYLERRYPEQQLSISATFHAERLSFVPGARIVVVTRRARMGTRPGPRSRKRMDAEGVWQEMDIDPMTYLEEVIESEPVNVRECIRITDGSMFSDQQVDMSELVTRLCEYAYPYRIVSPVHKDDRMYIMRANT